MTDENKNRRNVNIDINLDDLFNGLDGITDMMKNLREQQQEAFQQSGNSNTDDERVGGSYNFTFRFGGGIPPGSTIPRSGAIPRGGSVHRGRTGAGVSARSARPAGSTRSASTQQREPAADVREPLVDVFDEGETIIVVAELPGVTMADIRLDLQDDILRLETIGSRRYASEVLLPRPVDTTTMQQTYRNGILEVRLHAAPEAAANDED